MEESIARRLAELNRRFYAEHAEDFAETRPRLAAGVKQVLARIVPEACVLEVGCGDGKVGRALARAGVGLYVGVDESARMLERAWRFSTTGLTKDEGRKTKKATTDDRRQTTGETKDEPRKGAYLGRKTKAGTTDPARGRACDGRPTTGSEAAETPDALRLTLAAPRSTVDAQRSEFVLRPSSFVFLQADITAPGWEADLPERQYDWVLAFAVLHHLPGAAGRARVLGDLAGRLVKGGTLVMSNWQLQRSERLRRLARPWAEAGIAEAEVETGDYLLGWERAGRKGLRYVHMIEAAEARALAAAAGLRVVEVFTADGVTGDLTEYTVMGHG